MCLPIIERSRARLTRAVGLSVHLTQVHKESLDKVDNALPNRQGVDIEIFGMEGIPEDILQQHNQRITQEFYSGEAARRAASGNPGPGANAQNPSASKKPKFESPSDLKKRLAEHKAKKAAAAEQGVSLGSGSNTPVVSLHAYLTPNGPADSAQTLQGSPQPTQYQPPFSAPQGSPPQSAFPQPYGQSHGQPQYYGQSQNPFEYNEAPYGGPPPPQQGAYPPPGQFGPPQPQYSPPQQYGEQMGYPGGVYNQFTPGPGPAPFPAHSVSPFPPQYNQRLPPTSPPANAAPPVRQNSLPTAPGLPQRPSFNAPHVSRSQLHEMHSGQAAGSGEAPPPKEPGARSALSHDAGAISSSVDDLISNAQQAAQAPPALQHAENGKLAEAEKTTQVAAADTPDGAKKSSKKASRLIYSDQQVSPEEKMASMARYSFTPKKGEETVLGPVEAAVTGVVRGPDDVGDAVQG